jgi:Phage capsid family.
MKNKLEAQQSAAAAAQQIENLRAKAESGQWGEADQAALQAAKDQLKTSQEAERRFAEFEALELATSTYKTGQEQRTETPTASNPMTVNIIKSENRGDNEERLAKRFSLFEAVRDAAYGKSLTGLSAEIDQQGKMEARKAGITDYGTGAITLPAFMVANQRSIEKRDMLAGTTTAGGFTVQTEVGELIPFLDPRLTVRQLGATYLTGLSGNVDFPRNNAAAAVGRKTEVATADETSPTFDQVQLRPVRYTAFVDVSKQVILQSNIDMENFVRNRLNEALFRKLEEECFTNSDSTGIFDLAGVNDITIGTNGGDLTWELIVKFESEIAADNADMGRLGYLFTPQVAGKLKTAKRDVAGNGFIWEGPNTAASVNGYQAYASNLLPKNLTKGGFTSVLHGGVFGNWADLLIGQFGGVDILINPYTKGKEATVEVIVNAWFDHAIRQAASFCKCDELYPS